MDGMAIAASRHADDDELSLAVGNFSVLRWTYGLINRLVMTFDVASMATASLLTWLFGSASGLMLTPLQGSLITVLEVAAFVSTMVRLGAYRVERYKPFWSPLGFGLIGFLIAWLVGGTYLAAFANAPGRLPAVLLEWLLPQVPALLINRQIVRWVVTSIERRGWLRRRTVLIGANQVGELVLAQMRTPAQAHKFDIIGVFANSSDERRAGMMGGLPIAGIDVLAEFARHNMIDLIVVALPLPRAAQFMAVMEHLQWISADVVIPMGDIGMQRQSPRPAFASVTDVAGMSTLQVMHRPLKGSQALLKLIQDYVVAVMALILAGPVMIAAAIAIRIDSPGPILFRQKRIGFNNKPFSIYKFRTMLLDPSDDGSTGVEQRDDPRITRVGRLLRTLSVDELPQLFNVLRGEMSIVGPRPYVPNMLIGSERFHCAVRNFAFRYRMKPGITGLAQANGLRSSALRSKENARRSVEMDIHYIMNWSLWLDLRIMAQTLLLAMTGPEVF
jgi:putative colanic acid biosynthesis UDP-glucose lipid carrier transferase